MEATVDVEDIVSNKCRVAFSSVSPAPTTFGPVLKWKGVKVPAEGQKIITLEVKVDAPKWWRDEAPYDKLPNTVSVSDQLDPSTVTTVTNLGPEVIPGKIEKKVLTAPGNEDGIHYEIGQPIAYRIEFTSGGGLPGLVHVFDKIPKGVEYIAGSSKAYYSNGEPMDATFSDDYPFSRVMDCVTEELPAQTQGYIDFQVIIKDEALGSEIQNSAHLYATEDMSYLYKYSNMVTSPVVNKKSEITAHSGKLLPGGEILYTIAYDSGTTTPYDVVKIEDVIPANTTYVPGSATVTPNFVGTGVIDETGIVGGTGKLKWTISGIGYGCNGTVTFKVKVNPDADKNTIIKNKGEIAYGKGTVFEAAKETNEVKNKIDLASLVIGKIVQGDGGEKNKYFSFTITLKDGAGAPLSGTYEYVGRAIPGVAVPPDGSITLDSSGQATVSLKHGQTIDLTLESGIGYKIVENEANTDNYITSVTNDQKTNLSADETVIFVNEKNIIIPTGISASSRAMWLLLAGMALVGISLVSVVKVSNRKRSYRT